MCVGRRVASYSKWETLPLLLEKPDLDEGLQYPQQAVFLLHYKASLCGDRGVHRGGIHRTESMEHDIGMLTVTSARLQCKLRLLLCLERVDQISFEIPSSLSMDRLVHELLV